MLKFQLPSLLQTNACQHVGSAKQLFASPQCLGYHNEHGELTHDLCTPSLDLVKKQIKAAVKKVKARAVYIAADVEPPIKEIQKFLGAKVTLTKLYFFISFITKLYV